MWNGNSRLGEVNHERWKIDYRKGFLGEGTFGVVYLATDFERNFAPVAVKIIRGDQ